MDGDINKISVWDCVSPNCNGTETADSVHQGQSPLVPGDTCVSNMKIADLKKLIFCNFAKMQEILTTNVLQNIQTFFPEIVRNTTLVLEKSIKNLQAAYETTRAELCLLKEEHEKLKSIAAEQQRFLTTLDTERRASNVIITGVEENDEEESAKTVEKILEEIGCEDIKTTKVERLGRLSETNKKRPIKVTFNDTNNRNKVLSSAKKLKQSQNPDYKTVYIKKDTNPQTRREMARLRDVTKKEKDKPENVGKNVTFDHKMRRVLVDGTEVDRFKHPLF